MIDTTLHIVTVSATHDADDSEGLHLFGEFIGVLDRVSGGPALNRRLGFIHVDDVPVDSLSELQFLLEQNLDGDGLLVSRSLWRIDSTLMTVDELDEIAATNEVSATWLRLKAICKNVVTDALLTDDDL